MYADPATDPDAAAPSDPLRPILSAALPALDPHHGRPLAPILRGAAADLGRLRRALASAHPDARRQLLEVDLGADAGTNAVGFEDDDDRFSDASDEDPARALGGGGEQHDAQRQQQDGEAEPVGDGGTKRGRENDDDGIDVGGEESDDDEADDDREPALLYLPSVRCTCPSWDMADVPGDLMVTALRVLFLPEARDGDDDADVDVDADGARDDDLAIDRRCVALHAVDAAPGPTTTDDGEKGDGDGATKGASRHVYCQLAESFGDEAVDGGGGVSATGTFAPARILEDIDGRFDDDDGDDDEHREEDGEEDGASSRGDGTVEVYFQPEGGTGEREGQSDKCQRLFDALTRLASLSAAGDADAGGFGFGDGGAGGLFGMLSLMAGLDGAANGFGDGMDDDAVVRLGGGGNHLVEEEGDESEGASDEARRAMLDRLDNMLVVPPEYEVASSSEEDGRFEDAEEEEEDDDGVDELL